MQVFVPIATVTDAELVETISRVEEEDEKQILRDTRVHDTKLCVQYTQAVAKKIYKLSKVVT
jgi:hypothetical protein